MKVTVLFLVAILILLVFLVRREGYSYTTVGGYSDIINWNYEPVDMGTTAAPEQCAEKSKNYTSWTWSKTDKKCTARNYTENPVNKTLLFPDSNPYIEQRLFSSGCKDITKLYPNCTDKTATSDPAAPVPVAGWSDQINIGGEKSVELSGANTEIKCKNAATAGTYTSWTFRKSNHMNSNQRNTCTASKYYVNPKVSSLKDTGSHTSACTDSTMTFPACTNANNYCAPKCSDSYKEEWVCVQYANGQGGYNNARCVDNRDVSGDYKRITKYDGRYTGTPKYIW
jgi:hypothetical protein